MLLIHKVQVYLPVIARNGCLVVVNNHLEFLIDLWTSNTFLMRGVKLGNDKNSSSCHSELHTSIVR